MYLLERFNNLAYKLYDDHYCKMGQTNHEANEHACVGIV